MFSIYRIAVYRQYAFEELSIQLNLKTLNSRLKITVASLIIQFQEVSTSFSRLSHNLLHLFVLHYLVAHHDVC